MSYQDYITTDPEIRGGKPCVRGSQITVYEVLEHLASDKTEEEILKDSPGLTHEDLKACVAFAADLERKLVTVPEAGAGSQGALDALPVGSTFRIEFTSEGSFSDEMSGYLIYGQLTIGDDVYGFSNVATQGSWQDHNYLIQWREAAERIVSGHDRSAFITNTGAGGWKTVFEGRWLIWREGEKVYLALDRALADSVNEDNPYQGIESLQSAISSRSAADFSALHLQAIRDYLSSRTREADRPRLRGLERPCDKCGKEMRRCNRCSECLNCAGGLGNVELGYCKKCQNIGRPF